MSKSEREFVRWLRERFPADAARVPIGIGDDMAAISLDGGAVLVTADMLMDGVDFRAAEHEPQRIGRKALACGLSDCAAMAVRPVAAVVSLALPDGWTLEQAQALYLGMQPLAEEFGTAIVGGDTNSWSGPLVIDVTVIAECWPDQPPVRRSSARIGDGLFVSGPLGGSILGRHLDFTPRVAFARLLAGRLGDRLHAMMDLSDGLLLDLSRICEASGVGAELDAAAIAACASDDAHRLADQDKRSAMEHALSDGEDFELLCVVAADAALPAGLTAARTGEPWLRPVGRIVPSGLHLVQADGRREAVEPRGYEHFQE